MLATSRGARPVGRAGVPGAALRPARRPSCSCIGHGCARPSSSRTARCWRSRAASTAFRSRSSWPPPRQGAHPGADPGAARPEPRRDRRRPRRPPGAAADAARGDRLELRAPRRTTSRRCSPARRFAGGFDLDAAEAVGGAISTRSRRSSTRASLARRRGTIRDAARPPRVRPRPARRCGRDPRRVTRARPCFRDLVERIEPRAQDGAARRVDRAPRRPTTRNFVRAIEWALESRRLGARAGHLREASPALVGARPARGGGASPTGHPRHAHDADASTRQSGPRRLQDWPSCTATSTRPWPWASRRWKCTRATIGVRVAGARVFLGSLYQAVGRPGGREPFVQGLAGLQASGDEYGTTIAAGGSQRFRAVGRGFLCCGPVERGNRIRGPRTPGWRSSRPWRRATRRRARPRGRSARRRDGPRGAATLLRGAKMPSLDRDQPVRSRLGVATEEPGTGCRASSEPPRRSSRVRGSHRPKQCCSRPQRT